MPRELTYEQRNGEPFVHSRFGTKWTYEQWVEAQKPTASPVRPPLDTDDFTDMVAQRNLLLESLESVLPLVDDPSAYYELQRARAAILKVRPR